VRSDQEDEMQIRIRPTTAAVVLVLLGAFAIGARWLAAGFEAQQAAPAEVTPLADFEPSERLSTDAAVAFPTDI
jgi:hypothetical protein